MVARWLPAVAMALLVAGCSTPAGVTVVAVTAGSVTVSTGDTLDIDLGLVNPSIGDAWFLQTPADPAVLTDRGRQVDGHCDQPGCGSHQTWRFTATTAGRTTVTFRYCYRTPLATCDPGPGRGPAAPVSLTVVVT